MHCVSIAEFEVNLDCHVLRVQARWSCVDLDRTGYHAVDAGFWVVLELIIRWIRIRFDLIDLSVDTKNWHQEEADMWAGVVEEISFGKGVFPQRHSAKTFCGRERVVIRQRHGSAGKSGSIREGAMTWKNIRKRPVRTRNAIWARRSVIYF